MKKGKNRLVVLLALSLMLPATMMIVLAMSGVMSNVPPARMEGPCDIYAAAGTPCVAAHSSTRALYASYNGPLYQVLRRSDGKTLDIGVVQLHGDDAGGYADAAAQDAFCANTYCWISVLYDQSGKGNHLRQAPRGNAGSPPAMGGFNNLPLADMAPVTLMGHKVYGIYIEPGMGLRQNDPKGTAVDDQAEGQYWVVNGLHYNSGCCFDYGNAEIDSRANGQGTMETTYYGVNAFYYHGQAPGPWIMTDQEANLVGCVTDSPNNKYCPDLPSINWRFVTATADGEPHHWRTMGGDAQGGDLKVMFDGPRVANDRNGYDPMRKEGAIVLGNGGDNNSFSQGTVYEAAMTKAGTFPTKETNQKIQANVVAARYDVQRLSLAPANATDMPPGLQTFSPRSSQNATVTFTNTTEAPVRDLTMSITVPLGWNSVVLNSKETSEKFPESIAPGTSVSASFTITSGPEAFNGDMVGKATWTNSANRQPQSEIAIEKVRNVDPIRINEFRISDGSNTTNSFIELYNAGDKVIDISNWALTMHSYQMPVFSSIDIPGGTKLASKGFYLLGLSTSGLAVPAKKGESTIYVRNTTGMSVGDVVEIGQGANMEKRTIKSVGTPAGLPPGVTTVIRSAAPGNPPTIWQPLPDGPVITIPKGSKNIPVESMAGIVAGQKIGIGYGAIYPIAVNPIERYEVVTVTGVGKKGTQGWLSKDAKAGDTNIKVYPAGDISVGDKIRLDIESEGHGIEWVTVTKVGTQSVRSSSRGPLSENEDPGTGLDLAEPLKFNHSSNLPFSCRGTGISFEPATAFDHSSNEPVLPLGTGITLDQPLNMDHEIHSVILEKKVTIAGYHGTPGPDQWFGGPALSLNAGNMVLRDAAGNVVDGLNYGLIVDAWSAEGYMGVSGPGESGCKVPLPVIAGTGGGGNAGGIQAQPEISAGRYPDGNDNDSNCRDFRVQSTVTTMIASTSGSVNLKVGSVVGLKNGQTVIIDTGADRETAVIAIVGTTGATTLNTSINTGNTILPVVSVSGFTIGQAITIGSGSNSEAGVISAITSARGGRGGVIPGGTGAPGTTTAPAPVNSITVATPLTRSHAADTQVSGSGITFTRPLTRAHGRGALVASGIPSPGRPNQY